MECIQEFISTLNTSDIIQIISIFTSTLVSIIAISISVKTMRDNSKMMEENSRPYMCIYVEKINITTPMQYIVFKNIGNSSTIIKSVKCDYKFTDKQIPGYVNNYFNGLVGATFAPQQSRLCFVSFDTIPNGDKFNFEIAYTFGNKTYSDKFTIDLNADTIFASMYVGKENRNDNINDDLNHLKYISGSLQELVKKKL